MSSKGLKIHLKFRLNVENRHRRSHNLLYFFGHPCCMWKFLGQGSNPSHSSELSHSSDNTRSLIPGLAQRIKDLVLPRAVV